MDINCPSCLARLKIALEKIPPQGAWAQCPKCKEKFVVKSQEQLDKLIKEVELGSSPIPKKHLRTPKEERLLKRLQKDAPPAPPTFSKEDMPIIHPEVSSKLPSGCLTALALFLIVVSSFLLISLKMAMPKPQETVVYEPVQPSPKGPAPYTQERFTEDIATIARKLTISRNRPYEVKSSGPETRVARHILAECEVIPDLFVLESVNLVPRLNYSGVDITLHFSGRLQRTVYLSLIDQNHTCGKQP